MPDRVRLRIQARWIKVHLEKKKKKNEKALIIDGIWVKPIKMYEIKLLIKQKAQTQTVNSKRLQCLQNVH